MKRAALYARVSTDMQKEEGTIESQLFELKQQVTRDENVLVKEYIDEGFTGGRLDRPALEQLRADLKTNLFDIVYFHCADRIARDVMSQLIIIGDFLKNGKQLVINGKDYIENPENKFTLTVLGAVAELEKAKFAERSLRGRRHKARQGIPGTGGNVPYGYTYVKKTDKVPQHIIVDEERASTVRFMFETFANSEIGINELTRAAQETGTLSSQGKVWSRSSVHFIIRNTAYHGQINYYTVKRVPAGSTGPKHIKFRRVPRDPSEHITINIPPIISQELFDRVQEKLSRNRKVYRKPIRKYLLSGLVECGHCGRNYVGYSVKHEGRGDIKYKNYQCNHNLKMHDRSYKHDRDRCDNKSTSAPRIEVGVWEAVLREILNPAALKTHVEVLRTRTRERDEEYQQKLTSITKELKKKEEEKARILDLYAVNRGSKEAYFRKVEQIEKEEQKLREDQAELVKLANLIPNPALIRKSIDVYCERMKARLPGIVDYAGKRKFLLDVIDHMVFDDDTIRLRGFLPLLISSPQNPQKQSAPRDAFAMYCPRGELIFVWKK